MSIDGVRYKLNSLLPRTSKELSTATVCEASSRNEILGVNARATTCFGVQDLGPISRINAVVSFKCWQKVSRLYASAIESQSSVSDRIPRYSPLKMLEKRKSRGGGSDGSSVVDNWDAPPLIKAQMAVEIIWFCIVLYLISALIKVLHNVPSRHRQPYILLIISAIFLDISLIMDAVAIRIDDTIFAMTYSVLNSTIVLLWQQPIALFTMAGLWVFRKRSLLIIYGPGATGILYAGQMWKFAVDWTIASFSLLFLVLAFVVIVTGDMLYWDFFINYSHYRSFYNVTLWLTYVQFAFYFILTIIFVITGIMLSCAFKRQMGHPDVVRHFPTRMRTPVHFNVGHSSDADMGHALAHQSCILYPD